MDNKSVMEKFNEKCAPFYLVDHDNGTFSLCYPFSFVDEKYRFYGQEAFDKYAERIGEPARDERGFCTHGNGYEWAVVFNKFFENDRDFARLHTDCEAGGFFCYCDDLNLMVEVGLRFKNLIDDTYTFTKTVHSALEEDKIKQKAEIEYRKTMHYFLQNAPLADMILTTSEGEFLISEDQLKGLRDGKESIAFIGDYEMSAEDFGSMEIQSKHYDSNGRVYRVQADIPEEIIYEGMGGM